MIELNEAETKFYQDFAIGHNISCDAELSDMKISVYGNKKYVRCLVCGKIEEIV